MVNFKLGPINVKDEMFICNERYLGGDGFDSRRGLRFFLCRTLVTNKHFISINKAIVTKHFPIKRKFYIFEKRKELPILPLRAIKGQKWEEIADFSAMS